MLARPRDVVSELAETVRCGLDWVSDGRLRSALAILAVALCCSLPGFFSIPPVDRDEPRFAQASRQMLESGNFVDIRLQDEPRNQKPIGIYWLQAAAVKAVGAWPASPIWAYRLPSLLGATAASLLTWWMALAFVRSRAALLAGALLAATLLLAVEARLAKTDAVLLALVVLAQGALARVWIGRAGARANFGNAFLFWTAIALQILVKGPVGPLISFLVIACLTLADGSSRWLRRLRPLAGLAWVVLIVLPWLTAIVIATNGRFLFDSIGRDMLGKLTAVQESHGAPPGTYLVLFFLTFWPGTAFVALSTSWIFDHLKRPPVLFALAWIVPFWIGVETAPTKLPHYVLPTYPALAFLAAVAADEGAIRVRGTVSRILALGPVGVPAVLLVVAPAMFMFLEGRFPWSGTAVLLAAVAAGIFAWHLLAHRGEPVLAVPASVVSAALLYAGVLGVMVPDLSSLHVSRRAVEAARAAAGCAAPAIASAGFDEPSLIFLAGTDTKLGGAAESADFLRQTGCRAALIERRALGAFLSRADDLGLRLVERGRVEGWNISNGRRLSLSIYIQGENTR